jgi:hypothetical protein
LLRELSIAGRRISQTLTPRRRQPQRIEHPLDEVVPAGGMIMLIGWLALIVSPAKAP